MTAIGIDLGTTNSVVATYDLDRGQAKVVTIGSSARSTPSVVSTIVKDGTEEVLVGRTALNFAGSYPIDTIFSVKRLMGRDFADPEVKAASSKRSYRIVPGPDNDPRAHVVMRDKRYTPAQVSTFILDRLVSGAATTLGTNVTHAVITVPAYFREAQRAATREAGERAGLVVKRIIDEPTAAAIAFGLELREGDRRRILVYDLGGGTFDISILNTTRDNAGHPHFQVLEFNGDNWLGGDDFDELIVQRIIDWVKENANADPSEDTEFLFRARREAENAKRALDDTDVVVVNLPWAHRSVGGYVDVHMTLTRQEFDAMIEPQVDRTISLVRTTLDRQNLTPAEISDVLLVGGATLTPKVYEAVEEFFGKDKVRRHIDPMECVAIGAGILASTLHGIQCQSCKTVNDESAAECEKCEKSLFNAPSTGDTHVYDVTGMALGVAAVKGSHKDTFVPIIPRSTPYPMSTPLRHTFETTDGRRIRVPVYEGDKDLASENQEQGVIDYQLPEEVDIHTRVDVSFLFDRNRELHVTISVPGTGLEHREKLRIDTERTQTRAAGAVEDDDDTGRTGLIYIQELARRFRRDYEQYLDPSRAMKIDDDLQRAQQTLMFSDPAECRHVKHVLEDDVVASGLASELYLAELTAYRASAADQQQLNQAITLVRQAFQQGKHDVVAEQAQALKMLVARVRTQIDVVEVRDAEDFAGLLKMLDES